MILGPQADRCAQISQTSWQILSILESQLLVYKSSQFISNYEVQAADLKATVSEFLGF
jgi:hypothetical protein